MTRRTVKAYLLCGPSLAGKSSLALRLSRTLGARVLCADAINAERSLPFGGEGLPESAWEGTLRILLERIGTHLRSGQRVIVDDTLCYRWLRDLLRSECEKASAPSVLLLLAPAGAELLRRFDLLGGSGGRPVLSRERMIDHLARFEWPAAEEAAIDVTKEEALEAFLRSEETN